MINRLATSRAGVLWLTIAFMCAMDAGAAQPDPDQTQLVQASADDAVWVATLAQVQEVQRRLAELGFDPGGADGKIGPRTIAAIRKYQQSIEIEADGKLTADLYRRLTTPPDAVPTATPTFTEPAESAEESQQSTDCPLAAGRWLFEDQQGSSFELTLDAAGRVTGTAYPRHWHWGAENSAIEIDYDNGMGLTVARRGRLEQADSLKGDATDSRGRNWTWTAKRLEIPAGTTGIVCPSVTAH